MILIKSYDQHINNAKQSAVNNEFIDMIINFSNNLCPPSYNNLLYCERHIPELLSMNIQLLKEITTLKAWLNANYHSNTELSKSLQLFYDNYITVMKSCLDEQDETRLQNTIAIIADVNLSLSTPTLLVPSIHDKNKNIFVIDRLSERLQENKKPMNIILAASIVGIIVSITAITLAAIFCPIVLLGLTPISALLAGCIGGLTYYATEKHLMNQNDNMVSKLRSNFFQPHAPSTSLYYNEQKSVDNIVTLSLRQ